MDITVSYVSINITYNYVSHQLILTMINLRPAGGVFEHPPPPCGFSRIARKRRRAAPPTLPPMFLATFVKFSILGHARSGHQVMSSDHTLQKLYNRAPATVYR